VIFSSAVHSNKFMVYQSCLLELFHNCPQCGHSCDVSQHVVGTFTSVQQHCSRCVYTRKWNSQPMIMSIPAGNLQLSAAIYFSGASFVKMEQVLTALRLQSISSSTYYAHAKKYLQPTILSMWADRQGEILKEICDNKGHIAIGGDMRADSPGHCAKYGSYTVMDLSGNRVIHVDLVQVSNPELIILCLLYI
jgi:hypothetical protein